MQKIIEYKAQSLNGRFSLECILRYQRDKDTVKSAEKTQCAMRPMYKTWLHKKWFGLLLTFNSWK